MHDGKVPRGSILPASSWIEKPQEISGGRSRSALPLGPMKRRHSMLPVAPRPLPLAWPRRNTLSEVPPVRDAVIPPRLLRSDVPAPRPSGVVSKRDTPRPIDPDEEEAPTWPRIPITMAPVIRLSPVPEPVVARSRKPIAAIVVVAMVVTGAIMALARHEQRARAQLGMLTSALVDVRELPLAEPTPPAPADPVPAATSQLDAQVAVGAITRAARTAARRCFGITAPNRMSLEVTFDPSGTATRVTPPEWLGSSTASRCFVESLRASVSIAPFAGESTVVAAWVRLL
jgi:hypothetical protein